MILSENTVVGQYDVIRFLTKTVRSELYLGKHVSLGYRVVIKLARSTEIGSVIDQEVSVLRRLTHPTNVQILDGGTLRLGGEAHPYLVVEHIDGITLRELMRSTRRLSAQRVISITRQVLAGLEEAHTLGLVHGDIKPENIMLALGEQLRDQVKLIDYGIADAPGASTGETKGTTAARSAIWGTPRYLSPEVVRGVPRGPQSDLYSIGVIMYEAIAGSSPFDGDEPESLLAARLRDEPKRLDEVVPVAPQLANIVEQALAARPSARFRSAREFSESLLQCDRQELSRYPLGSPFVGEENTMDTIEIPPEIPQIPVAAQTTPTKQGKSSGLKSTGRVVVWALLGDPAMDKPELGEALRQLSDKVDVRTLDDEGRVMLHSESSKDEFEPPAVVVFGDMHVLLGDALLTKLAEFGETMRMLVSTHANVELAQSTINSIGLDYQVTLPATAEEIVESVNAAIARALARRQHYDCLRLAVFDMDGDIERAKRRLGRKPVNSPLAARKANNL